MAEWIDKIREKWKGLHPLIRALMLIGLLVASAVFPTTVLFPPTPKVAGISHWYDYVDSLSDVDDNADVGTHSNFEAQKSLDGYDTLTETAINNTIFQDDFPDFSKWDGNGATDWHLSSAVKRSSPYSAHSDENYAGYLTSDNIDTSSFSYFNVSFWFYDHGFADNQVILYYKNSSGFWNEIQDLNQLPHSEDTWTLCNLKVTDSQYMFSTFAIRFEADLMPNQDVYIDDVHIYNYTFKLRLEEKFTDVIYDKGTEELCIKTGSFSGETLQVQVWNFSSSTWITITTSLSSNSWNNITVRDYLTTVTFIIQFVGASETDDGTKDTFQIDATLLHIANVETRHFRSDSWTVNGLTAKKAYWQQSSSSSYVTRSVTGQSSGTLAAYFSYRVFVRDSEGAESEITSGYSSFEVSTTASSSPTEKTDSYSVSEMSLALTDSLVIRVYGKVGTASYSQMAVFTTEQLSASTLNATTWTAYFWVKRTAYQNPKTGYYDYTLYFYFGSSTYDSRIENIGLVYSSEQDYVTFSNFSTNTTQAGAACLFSVQATGILNNLDGYVFSSNVTGKWRNDSWVDLGGDASVEWLNVSKILHYKEGATIQAVWYVNDTDGNWDASEPFNLILTEEETQYVLTVTSFNNTHTEWTTWGQSPWLDELGNTSGINVKAANAKMGFFFFSDVPSDRHSVVGKVNVTLTMWANTSTTTTVLKLWFKTANGTWGYINVKGTDSDTYVNQTYELKFYDPYYWTPYRLKDLYVEFESVLSTVQVNIDYVQVEVEAWSRSHMIRWLWSNTMQDRVNSTFPYTKIYYEGAGSFSDWAKAEQLWGALLYKQTGNPAYLEDAYEYADWLIEQQDPRLLFEKYNYQTHEWEHENPNAVANIYKENLLALCSLASINSSYNELLENCTDEFIDLIVNTTVWRAQKKYWNGSAAEPNTWSHTHSVATVCIAYAGAVLNDSTYKMYARNMVLAYNLTSINIPPHSIWVSNGSIYESYSYCKEDETFGLLLLSAEFVYAYCGNNSIRDRIKDMAWAGAQYFYFQYGEDYCFAYRIDSETGNILMNYPVHGFGFIDEALITAYLLFKNSTWLDRVIDDFTYLAVQENSPLLTNDLIQHTVYPQMYYDESNDYWNAPAKRVALLLYCLDTSETRLNTTFYETYEKLYGATAFIHKKSHGWVQRVNITSFEPYTSDTPLMSMSVAFRNFHTVNVTVSNLEELYGEFGNPFTGEVGSIEVPVTILAVGWNDVTPKTEDIGKTLCQVNASLHVDSINFTVITFEYPNGTQISLYWLQATDEYWVENTTMTVTADTTIWIYCKEAGEWNHSYGS